MLWLKRMNGSVETTVKEDISAAAENIEMTSQSPKQIASDRLRVGTTAIALAIVAVFSKAMGFGEKIVIAHYFGTTSAADTYFAATGILLSAVFLVRELIYPTLLPTLNEALTHSSETFNHLFARMFRWTFLIMLVVAGAGVFLMPQMTNLLTPGFPDQQRIDLAHLLRWLLPTGIVMSLIAVTYTTLNAKGRLVTASLAEAASRMILLTAAILLIPIFRLDAIPAAMLISAGVCLAIHLSVLRPTGITIRQSSQQDNRLLRRTMILMAPIIIGVIFSHISDLVDNLLASRLPAGQLSYLNYAKKITDAILLIGPAALAVVLYTRTARLASLSRHGELAELVGKGLRLLLFIGVPIACLMIELRFMIVRMLFQHGSFEPSSTAGVSGALVVYGLGLAALSVEGLCVYTFYSLSDTRTPVAVGVLCVLLNIVLATLLVEKMGYLGIAAALVIAKSIKVAVLLVLLHRKLNGGLINLHWIGFAVKLLAAAFIMWLAIRLIDVHIISTNTTGTIIPFIGVCLIAMIVYGGASWLFGMKEPRLLFDSIPWKRFLNRRGGLGQ